MRFPTIVAPLTLSLALAAPLHAEDHKISMANWLFTPKVVTIDAGERVTWVNDDDSHHIVLFEEPGMQTKNSENIKPEKEFSATFDQPGEYKYYCKYHRDYGMVGTLVVKPAGK